MNLKTGIMMLLVGIVIIGMTASSASATDIKLITPFYPQETGSWCTAATVQMWLETMNGDGHSCVSQANIIKYEDTVDCNPGSGASDTTGMWKAMNKWGNHLHSTHKWLSFDLGLRSQVFNINQNQPVGTIVATGAHAVLVTGYSRDSNFNTLGVFIHDPSRTSGYRYYVKSAWQNYFNKTSSNSACSDARNGWITVEDDK